MGPTGFGCHCDVDWNVTDTPKGVICKSDWDNQRKLDLKNAIGRYKAEGVEVPPEWYEEYYELITQE